MVDSREINQLQEKDNKDSEDKEEIVYSPHSYIVSDRDVEFINKSRLQIPGHAKAKRSSSFKETVHSMGEGLRNIARRTKSLDNVFHHHHSHYHSHENINELARLSIENSYKMKLKEHKKVTRETQSLYTTTPRMQKQRIQINVEDCGNDYSHNKLERSLTDTSYIKTSAKNLNNYNNISSYRDRAETMIW